MIVQSASRETNKFTSKGSELQNITKLKNKTSRLQDEHVDTNKDSTQQFTNQHA